VKKEEVEVFLSKARGFEKIAKQCFDDGIYDLSIFCLEQSAQLYLKTKLYELVGEFPRTHDLIKLLEILSSFYRNEEVKNFIGKNLDLLAKLIDAYITSRYYTRRFYREEVESAFRILKELKDLLRYD